MFRLIKKTAIALGRILFAPIRALLELTDWAAHSAGSGGDSYDEEVVVPLWRRILLFPVRRVSGTASILWQIVRFPVQGLLSDPIRVRHLAAAAPALIALTLFAYVMLTPTVSGRNLETMYSNEFDQANRDSMISRATLLANRLIRPGVRRAPEPTFRFCKMLAVNNQLDRANAIIESLAPESFAGYPPAHEQRAVAYASLVGRGVSNETVLNALIWHLNKAGERSSEDLLLAKATYYRETRQADACIAMIEAAARMNPIHWFTVTDLSLEKKDPARAERALNFARKSFSELLAKDPLKIDVRILFSQAQVRLGLLDDAEDTLRSGLEFFPEDAKLRRAKNLLDLTRYDRMVQDKKSVDELTQQLLSMLETSQEPTLVYDRMLGLYNQSMSDENRARIRTVFEQEADKNQEVAVLQFALSTVAIVDKRFEDAIRLLERTLELDPNQHLAKNNLAWLLADAEPPQLDRSKQLAEEALAALEAPNYRDTLGHVLLMRGEYDQAVIEFERALPGMRDKAKTRTGLAAAYRKLGNEEMAVRYEASSTKRP